MTAQGFSPGPVAVIRPALKGQPIVGVPRPRVSLFQSARQI